MAPEVASRGPISPEFRELAYTYAASWHPGNVFSRSSYGYRWKCGDDWERLTKGNTKKKEQCIHVWQQREDVRHSLNNPFPSHFGYRINWHLCGNPCDPEYTPTLFKQKQR